jgi:hypothetical protein
LWRRDRRWEDLEEEEDEVEELREEDEGTRFMVLPGPGGAWKCRANGSGRKL